MSDYIRREDAIKTIKENEICCYCSNTKVLAEIRNLPTIGLKRGKWVNQHEWSNGFFERECSVCGAMKPLLRHTAKINYCPNCGAKMEPLNH